jgi:hypothetical protein
MINLSKHQWIVVGVVVLIVIVGLDVLIGTTVIPRLIATPTPTHTPTPAPIAALILNVSFEEDPLTNETLWKVDEKKGDLSAEWSVERARTGTHSLHLSASQSAGGWPGWFTVEPIPVVEGVEYTFSVWAFTPDAAWAWISVEMLDANGRFLIGFSGQGCTQLPVGSWTRLTAPGPTSRAPGVTQVRLGLQQCLTFTEGKNTNLFYDDVFFGIK